MFSNWKELGTLAYLRACVGSVLRVTSPRSGDQKPRSIVSIGVTIYTRALFYTSDVEIINRFKWFKIRVELGVTILI